MNMSKQFNIKEGDKTVISTVTTEKDRQVADKEEKVKQLGSFQGVQRQLLVNQPGILLAADMVSNSYNLESSHSSFCKQSGAFEDRQKAKTRYLQSQFAEQEKMFILKI